MSSTVAALAIEAGHSYLPLQHHHERRRTGRGRAAGTVYQTL